MCVKLAETDKKSLSGTVKLCIPRFFKNIEKSTIVHAANNNARVTFNNCQHYVGGIQLKKKKTEKCILYTDLQFPVF